MLYSITKDNITAIPVVHYSMEMAAHVKRVFDELKPDCVAVELAETLTLQLLHAASRLPDISIVITQDQNHQPIYYLAEPCDPAFEALRSALEGGIAAFCIDLDVDAYPDVREPVPDPYAIQRIGLQHYYEIYLKAMEGRTSHNSLDKARESYMARRLKELSLTYERVLFIGGMAHVDPILKLIDSSRFPDVRAAEREFVQLCTVTEESCREILPDSGWTSTHYEQSRLSYIEDRHNAEFPPDRQKLVFQLYKDSSEDYIQDTGNQFPGYHLRNCMKFVRNFALLQNRLLPDLYQILCSAKGCVDHNYAYAVWRKATEYPYRKNIDGLPELDLSVKEVWGHSKILRFHLKQPGRKTSSFNQRLRKDRSKIRFQPPGPFAICSYPPEDLIVENYGDFLKKKGTQILTEEGARSQPFISSLEDGLDTKETIRHWHEKKLYVKVHGKPPGGVGSVVMIFDEDSPHEGEQYHEKFTWKTTWLGEHNQESDMALYATLPSDHIVGPGISRCEYGGFMMSSPPRRLQNVWFDPDYFECRTKAEVLLSAAIDYAQQPIVVYVAAKPPRSALKSFAQRFGKKIVYIPIGQLSPVTLNKLRAFHVLDGHDKRTIADEYIF